jgi:hypothetical protein
VYPFKFNRWKKQNSLEKTEFNLIHHQDLMEPAFDAGGSNPLRPARVHGAGQEVRSSEKVDCEFSLVLPQS